MSTKNKKLLFISDPHIWSSERNASASRSRAINAPKRGRLGTFSRAEELGSLCSIIAEKYDPEEWVILISGDIVEGGLTNRTRQQEHRNAERALRPLMRAKFDIQMVPGNHDYGPFGNSFNQDAYNRYRALHKKVCGYDTTFPHCLDYGKWRMILLDSTAHFERGELFARGRIGEAQLNVLNRELSSSTKPVLIAMHHHPIMRSRKRTFLEVVDSEAFMATLSRARGRVTVCCGHKHVKDLAFRRSGKLLGIAADKSTDSFNVILIDPANQRVSETGALVRQVNTSAAKRVAGAATAVGRRAQATAKKTARKARTTVKKTAANARKKARATVGNARTTVKKTARSTTRKARATAKKARSTARKTVRDTTNKARSTAKKARSTARRIGSKIGDRLRRR